MSERLTAEQRHKNMAAIHGKDTKPEMVVRRYLWGEGFRYRLNHPRLPGKPDIVLRKYRTCIFVNGCFWHGHMLLPDDHIYGNAFLGQKTQSDPSDGRTDCAQVEMPCRYFVMPKSNTSFWERKITRNRERDQEVQHQLARMGWHCITVWECQLKPTVKQQTLDRLKFMLYDIYLQDRKIHRIYEMPEEDSLMVAEEQTVYGQKE